VCGEHVHCFAICLHDIAPSLRGCVALVAQMQARLFGGDLSTSVKNPVQFLVRYTVLNFARRERNHFSELCPLWKLMCRAPKAHAPGPELNAIALREALCCFQRRQGRVELFERPVYFAAGDHKGWTNTDGVVVGILA
jgi:hypothetical protein